MGNLIKITDFKPEYSENLLPYTATFDEITTVNVTSGSMTYAFNDTYFFDGKKSMYVRPTSYKTTDLNFNFGTALQTTIKNSGTHFFSLRILNHNTTPEFFVPFVMRVKVWVNSVIVDELLFNSVSDLTTYQNKWVTYGQGIDFLDGDVVDFTFQVDADLSYPFNIITFYMDAFKLEFDDRFLSTPSIFSKPLDQLTGWQSKVDTINTQNLTANTDNLIAFTGTDASNGGLTLMNSVGKITPIKMGDALAVDFVFTFPSPVGTTDYLSVKLKVNGVVYRAQSFSILEPTGETNYVAVSFNLPVETDFYTYGAEFFVNPNVAITISNRYLQVTRVHKGV